MLRGIGRSLWIYYADPRQIARMRAFYRQFVRPGDVAFDIGAHVGSRTLAFSMLGAQVVAVEPVPPAMRVLQVLYGRHPRVTLVEAAVGKAQGHSTMLVCEREPTISTLSAEWAGRMQDDREAFASVRWGRSLPVAVTTLDALIQRHGAPAFCKVDVEGYDLEVLEGLSQPLAALSFEYVPPGLDLALACVARLRHLGEYEFNWSWGDSMRLHWSQWVTPRVLCEYLTDFPRQGNPGDVYARLRSPARPASGRRDSAGEVIAGI
jgi:FkbM family methyltransferase